MTSLSKRTYGTITHDPSRKRWRIKCEPHVAIRIKRVFGKIDTTEHGVINLSASKENCRDIEWFLERYPMTVTPLGLLQDMSREHREIETTVAALLRGVRAPLSVALKIPPREYQVDAAQLWDLMKGYLLGDDVGLGKTASSITGLVQPGKLPALVVTLAHLTQQWKREIEKFTGLTVHIIRKGEPYDITKFHEGKFPDILIINYHKLSGWAETLTGLLQAVVFDECHELRHSDSKKYSAAKHIADSVEYKIGLSATPIFNYGSEIFNIMQVLQPDALGTYSEFVREWCKKHWGKLLIKDPVAFGLYLREAGLLLRRTRVEVKRELPPITIVPHTIDADPDVLTHMQGNAIELARLVLSQNEAFKGQKMQAAGQFDIKMRQATGLAKAPYVAEFVKFLHKESGEKIVLYGWHREVYSVWMEQLKDLNPVMYTGSESPEQKEASRKAFVEGDAQVMIISLRSGAGLDGLQDVCKIGVFGELDYSPSVHIQCGGRIHRDGQDDPVVLYYLIADSGSDPIISDILGVKRQQLEGINSPTDEFLETLQVEPDHIRRLAEDFLRKSGESVPEPEILQENAA